MTEANRITRRKTFQSAILRHTSHIEDGSPAMIDLRVTAFFLTMAYCNRRHPHFEYCPKSQTKKAHVSQNRYPSSGARSVPFTVGSPFALCTRRHPLYTLGYQHETTHIVRRITHVTATTVRSSSTFQRPTPTYPYRSPDDVDGVGFRNVRCSELDAAVSVRGFH
jgi:hypothetical protein